ncbi:MAG TPA: hypothetical protein PLK27_00450, partial [Neisseria sp.]|nr:hypothetical protein [Neisseria sp.]
APLLGNGNAFIGNFFDGEKVGHHNRLLHTEYCVTRILRLYDGDEQAGCLSCVKQSKYCIVNNFKCLNKILILISF